jgi:hypothetical protein
VSSALGSVVPALDQDLVDAPAIHVHDLESPVVPGQVLTGFGDVLELREKETR